LIEEKDVEIQVDYGGKVPAYQNDGDAGADIYSAEFVSLKPGETKAVGTQIRLSIPEGYEMQIRPRSGLAVKKGITVLNSPGTIDSTYRGEIKVILYNASGEIYNVSVHERIAQMVLAPVYKAKFNGVKYLDETSRGEGGFGSTGE